MRLKMDKQDGCLVVGLLGELDHHGATELRETVDAEIESTGPSCLVLDFSGVEFMDSSGFGFVMGRYKKMHRTGGTVTVRGARGHVKKMLELSGAGKYVTLE